MDTARKFFFAIPFDAATKRLYGRVSRAIRKRYPQVTTVIGNEEVGPSPPYSEIASFKEQNRELNRQFVRQIQEADVIIADLTHGNPNVHVELGLALLHNKNILRVTGRSLSELAFDIRNLYAHSYNSEKDLIKTITAYCDLFFKIKALPMSDEYGKLYFRQGATIDLDSSQNRARIQPLGGPRFSMRDGGIRVRFDFLSAETEKDWFGIYFRVGANPFWGSHLVYVRQNGRVEIAVYPGPEILHVHNSRRQLAGEQELIVEFENNHVHVQLGDESFQTNDLSRQMVGGVALATWNAKARVIDAEMICRDTIAWD